MARNAMELKALFDTWQMVKAEADDVNKRLDELKAMIREELKERNVTKLELEEYKAMLVTSNTTRLDTGKLKETLPNIYEQFKVITTSESLRISLNAKKK